MGRRSVFELQKVWGRRSFQLALWVLVLLNLFVQWYTHPWEDLAPYRQFTADLAGKSEAEKAAFVGQLQETIDGVSFVEEILAMQQSTIGAGLAEAELAAHPGLFAAYYDLYQSGDYLRYTDSLEQEAAFVHEIAAEQSKVAGYSAYLQSIRDRAQALSGISIFANPDTDSFASRNLQKSAADFADLSAQGIRWTPSKGIVSAMESLWTDLLLILLTFLFVGSPITEEKQKGLFSITRSTRYGMGCSMASRLIAFLAHCVVSAALLYGANLLYFCFAAGGWDISAPLQSLAPYLESCLPLNIGQFIALSVLTKALVLFAVGAVLIALCILCSNLLLPYLIAMAFWAGSWSLYQFIPAASQGSALKYLNLFGALRAESLYGTYLNLNVFGYPVSRLALSWGIVGIVSLAGVVLSLVAFQRAQNLGRREAVQRIILPYRPSASILRHESYKILITNRGLAVLLVFGCLIGYSTFRQPYSPAPQEQYYQSLLLQLEGPLTPEKEELLDAEADRYREAFAEIASIDAMAAEGAIDPDTASALKLPWQSITAFYPAFQRVEQQHEHVRAAGGQFLYDTGYLYLMGVLGRDTRSDFILLTVATVLAFCPAVSLEFQSGAWSLLCATARGKRSVLRAKIAVCSIASALFFALPFLLRWIHIAQTFPTHGVFAAAQDIPAYQHCPAFLPVIGLLLGKLLLLILVGLVLTLAMLGLSGWRKSHVQALFFGLVLLGAPILLAVLGFTFAQTFSLYPLYAFPFC